MQTNEAGLNYSLQFNMKLLPTAVLLSGLLRLLHICKVHPGEPHKPHAGNNALCDEARVSGTASSDSSSSLILCAAKAALWCPQEERVSAQQCSADLGDNQEPSVCDGESKDILAAVTLVARTFTSGHSCEHAALIKAWLLGNKF
jgi:hypothetical protein